MDLSGLQSSLCSRLAGGHRFSKPSLERPEWEEYNQRGYKSLWERGEGSWLGISAWDVMNLLFKLAGKTPCGKEEEVKVENSFLEAEAEDWESFTSQLSTTSKDLKHSGWFFYISKCLYCTNWLNVRACEGTLWKWGAEENMTGAVKVKQKIQYSQHLTL